MQEVKDQSCRPKEKQQQKLEPERKLEEQIKSKSELNTTPNIQTESDEVSICLFIYLLFQT